MGVLARGEFPESAVWTVARPLMACFVIGLVALANAGCEESPSRGLIISEIMTVPLGDSPNWVELYNPTGKSIAVGRIRLRIEGDVTTEWPLDGSASIGPHGHYVVGSFESPFVDFSVENESFLPARSGRVVLQLDETAVDDLTYGDKEDSETPHVLAGHSLVLDGHCGDSNCSSDTHNWHIYICIPPSCTDKPSFDAAGNVGSPGIANPMFAADHCFLEDTLQENTNCGCQGPCGGETLCLEGRCVEGCDGCVLSGPDLDVCVLGYCPASCVAGEQCNQPRDTGYEGDKCSYNGHSVGPDGQCLSDLLLWCGGPPMADGVELRWNFCPAYHDENGNPKECGINAAAGVPDCIPSGCGDLLFTGCDGNVCWLYDATQGDEGTTFECDFTPSTYPERSGSFRSYPGRRRF